MRYLALLAPLLLGACGAPPPPGEGAPTTATPSSVATSLPPSEDGPWPFTFRDASEIPDGPEGAPIRRGIELLSHTYEELPEYVGADLHCTTCHLDQGTRQGAAPWVGVSARYPRYRARSGKVDTLEERVNGCMQRSMNGRPLPEDGAEMASIVAYMDWLSEGVPDGRDVEGRGIPKEAEPPEPDREHGAELYAQRCAACHQPDGSGLRSPDGAYVYPPLWGDRAYNVGAGMARLDTAASFIRHNMPLGQGGSLTVQEAYDVADFVIHQPRPDLPGKARDWPKGGKPRDTRY